MKRILVLMLIIQALGRCVLVAGAGNRAGTNGASELLIPVGTRDIAMGGATNAIVSGIDALWCNPAGSARINGGLALFFSHMNYIADIGVDCGAVSVEVPQFGVLSLSIKSLSFGDIPVTTALTPDGTGQTFHPQYFTLGLTYARQLTDRVAVGATAMVISEHIAEVSASGVAFSAGVTYDGLGGIKGLSCGIAVKNVGPTMTFEGPGLNILAAPPSFGRPAYIYKLDAASFELPSTIEIGVGYGMEVAEGSMVRLAMAFQNNNFSDDEYKGGIEYGYQNLIFLRGGYDLQPSDSDSRENIFGATFGLGLHAEVGTVDVSFDYAYRAVKYFEGNHVFSLSLGL